MLQRPQRILLLFFQQALDSGADGPAATNLRFEIGSAFEQSGDTQSAVDSYYQCYQDDPSHRDVADRLRALGVDPDDPSSAGNGEVRSDTPSDKPKSSKKSKISYI